MSFSAVCRTCLAIITNKKAAHNIDDENTVENLREMITLCVPEMDTYISMSPCICRTCYGILIDFHDFKVRCLQVESAIRSYISENKMMEGSSVDLRHVARLQALEGAKQKNLSSVSGRDLIASVNLCLNPNKTNPQQPVVANQLKKLSKAPTTSSAVNPAANRNSNDSRSKAPGYLKVRTNLMPERKGANAALNVNPLNIYASKMAASQQTAFRKSAVKEKSYDALQLCQRTGLFKKMTNEKPRGESESDDVIFVDSPKSQDDEVVLINDEPESGTGKVPVRAGGLKRKLEAPIMVEAAVTKQQKLQVNSTPCSLPNSAKPGEKRLVVKLRKDRLFKCEYCKFAALKMNTLKAHYYQRHEMCKLCNFKCVSKSTLNNHISKSHNKELQEVCKFYDNNITSDFICGLCKFSGRAALDLVQHRILQHIKMNRREKFQCPFAYCEFQHDVALNVDEHIDLVHDRPDRKECLMCNFVGGSVLNVKRHLQYHDQSMYTCLICGYKCRSSLKKHMLKNHQNVLGDKDDTTVGMVYDDVLDYEKLNASDDFKITLGPSGLVNHTIPTASTLPDGSAEERYSWDQPSLSEMLCGHMLAGEPQEKEVTELADSDSEVVRIKSPTNMQDKSATVLDDSDDCVLVGETGPIETVDLSDEDDVPPSEEQNDLNPVLKTNENNPGISPKRPRGTHDSPPEAAAASGDQPSSSSEFPYVVDASAPDDSNKSDETNATSLEKVEPLRATSNEIFNGHDVETQVQIESEDKEGSTTPSSDADKEDEENSHDDSIKDDTGITESSSDPKEAITLSQSCVQEESVSAPVLCAEENQTELQDPAKVI